MTEKKRSAEDLDRELIELLNELRVVLPGVQVLFAFLLAVPFSNGWKHVTALQRDVFFLAFLATAVASILLIAPSRTTGCAGARVTRSRCSRRRTGSRSPARRSSRSG